MALALATGAGVLLYTHRNDNPGCASGSPCTRVLFFGNSFTAVNDLPTAFADLAWSGGHRVQTGVQAPGGWTLADHAAATSTRDILNAAPWDVAVLQEQSQIPASATLRQSEMYPAARKMVSLVRAVAAEPLFFVTWAHRAGWPEVGLPDYGSMQQAIDEGYSSIAAEQHAAMAPVGFAWQDFVARGMGDRLWQGDGVHPTTTGTYLAACVFYAVLFSKSPVGLAYHSDLSDADADAAQKMAAATVFDGGPRWGLL